MVEEGLLDLNTWADAANDACAKVGSLTTELREWKDIAEERLFTAERLRTLCREAGDFIDCEGNDDLYDRLSKAGGETP